MENLKSSLRKLDITHDQVILTCDHFIEGLNDPGLSDLSVNIFVSAIKKACFFETQNDKFLALLFVLNEVISRENSVVYRNYLEKILAEATPYFKRMPISLKVKESACSLLGIWQSKDYFDREMIEDLIYMFDIKPLIDTQLTPELLNINTKPLIDYVEKLKILSNLSSQKKYFVKAFEKLEVLGDSNPEKISAKNEIDKISKKIEEETNEMERTKESVKSFLTIEVSKALLDIKTIDSKIKQIDDLILS